MPATPEDFQPQLQLEDRRIAIDAGSRRIAVRVASWDEAHSGFSNETVRMPRNVNVDAAHVGHAELEDGSRLRVATLPMDTMHAPKDMAAMHAAAWYENTGKAIARVRYSVDEDGIRADGLLYDDVEDAQIDRIIASSASGDWRSAVAVKRFSDFERTPADFIGSCIVNVPGFSDTFSKKAGKRYALAASAHTIISIEEEDAMEEEETVDVLIAGGDHSEGDTCDECPGGDACCKSGDAPAVEAAPEVDSEADGEPVTLTAAAALQLREVLDGLREAGADSAAIDAALTAAGMMEEVAEDDAAEDVSRVWDEVYKVQDRLHKLEGQVEQIMLGLAFN